MAGPDREIRAFGPVRRTPGDASAKVRNLRLN